MNLISPLTLAAATDSQSGETQGLACVGVLALLYIGWRYSSKTRFEVKELVGAVCIVAALVVIGYALIFGVSE